MKKIIALVAVLGLPVGFAFAQMKSDPAAEGEQAVMTAQNFADLKWQKINPEFGDASPEMAIIRVDEKTKATQLYIRCPKKIHVPRHFLSSNETHAVIKGHWSFTCDRCGHMVAQAPGDCNFVPAKCVHQAWASDDALLLITVDGAWDLNWVDGGPTKADLGVDAPKEAPKKK
jgi:mannose-6-phosphate isomerase-like protein (cupin superfamily)